MKRTGDAIAISDHFSYGRLLRYSLPSIIMVVFTSLYTIVDGLFVSNLAGQDAFTALNLIWPVIGILSAFGFMIGTGGTALVSRTLGEGDPERASQIFTMLIVFETVLGVAVSVCTLFFLEPIARFSGATDALMDDCIRYAVPLLGAQSFCFLANSYQSFLIAAGKPKLGLGISLACGFLNMFLDYILVAAIPLGILGASLATAFNWILGAAVPTVWFARHQEAPIHFVRFPWRLSALWQSCFNGLSEMVTNLSMSFVLLLYNLVLMKISGSEGVVIYGAVQYLGFLFASAFLGYTMAAAPCISYQYGAGNSKELNSLLVKSLVLTGISSIVIVLAVDAGAAGLAGLFVSYSPVLMEKTEAAIRIYSVSFLMAGFNIFASGFFTALNNGAVSAFLSLMRTFVFQAAAVFFLPGWFGLNGVWSASAAAEGLSLALSILFLVKMRKRYGY